MTALAALVALSLAAEPPSLTLVGSVRDEVRTGTAVALGGGTAAVGLEDALTPNLEGTWLERENSLLLRYDPELLIPDLGQGDHLQALHRGLAVDSWAAHAGSAKLTISEEVQYGIIDLFGLTPSTTSSSGLPQLAPTQVLQPIPLVTGIKYESSSSLADFQWRPAPRVGLDLGGGYRLNGGADAAAQASFPLQQGPFATASLLYDLSRRDLLTTRLSATDLQFSNGPSDLLLEGSEEASRRLTKHLLGTVAAGYSLVRFQAAADVPSTFNAYPEASASLVETLATDAHRTFALGVNLSLAPLIDRLGGTVFESFQSLGRLEWTATQGISLRLLGGFNEPLYGNLAAAQQMELAQGAVAYQPVRFLRFEVGGVGTWQQASLGGATSQQWLAFAAVVLQETVQK